MLHQYDCSVSLSQFLSYHQIEDGSKFKMSEDNTLSADESSMSQDKRASRNKPFTIAAILGLKNTDNTDISTNDVINLSMHDGYGINGSFCRLGQTTSQQYRPTGVILKPSSIRAIQQNNLLSSQKNCSKSKRVRTIFTPEQLERLEAEFERQQYMVGPERLYLAHTLQLTEAQVKVWFQNRRIKWRKHHLEMTHQRLAVLKQQQMLLEEEPAVEAFQNNSNSS